MANSKAGITMTGTLITPIKSHVMDNKASTMHLTFTDMVEVKERVWEVKRGYSLGY